MTPSPLSLRIAEALRPSFELAGYPAGSDISEIALVIESAMQEQPQEPKPAYRMLEVGEVIQEGDEFLEEVEEWRIVQRSIGMPMDARNKDFFRRKLTPELCVYCGKPESEHIGYWQYCTKKYNKTFTPPIAALFTNPHLNPDDSSDAAAFVRHCLESTLKPGDVYAFIPAGKAPGIGAILDAATGMVGMLPPEERTRATHAKLAGIAQWARETIVKEGK